MTPENRAEIIDVATAVNIYSKTTGLVLVLGGETSTAASLPKENACVGVFGKVNGKQILGGRQIEDLFEDSFNPKVTVNECSCNK